MRQYCLHQLGFAFIHLFGAARPEREAGVEWLMAEVSTTATGLFLAGLSGSRPPANRGTLVLDGVGWRISEEFVLPGNLTLIPLPPYSPEEGIHRDHRCNWARSIPLCWCRSICETVGSAFGRGRSSDPLN